VPPLGPYPTGSLLDIRYLEGEVSEPLSIKGTATARFGHMVRLTGGNTQL